jgi:hypothetical protein
MGGGREVGLSGNGDGLRRSPDSGGPNEAPAMCEAPKAVYLARARYAEEQAERCSEEEDRILWLDSAREYLALAEKAPEATEEEGPPPG